MDFSVLWCFVVVTAGVSSVHVNTMVHKHFSDSDCDRNRSVYLEAKSVILYFYDYKNNVNIHSDLREASSGLVSNTYSLDPRRKLVLFVPGYKTNIKGPTQAWTRDTFKKHPDTYLMIVDFSEYYDVYWNEDFHNGVWYSNAIGRQIGQFLADLNEAGFPSNQMHVVGHGYGGQLLAYIGKTYQKETHEKIGRMTSIEPLGVCFGDYEDHVRSESADYVEVFHCTFKWYTSTHTVADVDFFLNIEKPHQPGCKLGTNIKGIGNVDANTCSHIRCYKYWLNTVNKNNLYPACASYKKYLKRTCEGSVRATAGYHNSEKVKGIFYASTLAEDTANSLNLLSPLPKGYGLKDMLDPLANLTKSVQKLFNYVPQDIKKYDSKKSFLVNFLTG